MGNLHDGHCSLLVCSVKENDITVMSIFVNPTQFDDREDFKRYPKTLEEDIHLASEMGVDVVFIPNHASLYPDNYCYKVMENRFSRELCGQHRPGHFDGVLTIVLKLLLLVKPCRAYFGEKDFQQFKLIEGMAKSFFIDSEIIACPIVRDKNGLALSSRNHFLTPEEYKLALNFSRLLHSLYSKEEVIEQLIDLGIKVDYIEERYARRFGAVRIGRVRLIDNISISSIPLANEDANCC